MSRDADLFAGVRVSDFAWAREWYERLLGPVAFCPHATEAVWELAPHRFAYVLEDAGRAGGGAITVFVGDLDGAMAEIASRGLAPDETETYADGVRKATFRDPDGNEVGFGGAVGGAPAGAVRVTERGAALSFTYGDLLRFHGGGSPGGVAIAFKALERGLALLADGGRCERRQISIATAFDGPGARDGFEMATRAVGDGRYAVDPELRRRDLGPARERFVFRLAYRDREVTLTLRDGFVTGEFAGLAFAAERTAAEASRLEILKAELSARVMAAGAAEVFDAD